MKLSRSLFSSLMLIGALVISSCVQESNQSTLPQEIGPDHSVEIPAPVEPIEPVDQIDQPTGASVEVAVYTEFPDAIDGCACYFGKTAPELSDGKYIFTTNYDKKAFMQLDGKMREFDLVKSTNLDGGRLMEKWKNENYEMVVKSTETGQVDETWQRIGTINIKPKDKDATMIDVVGECGC